MAGADFACSTGFDRLAGSADSVIAAESSTAGPPASFDRLECQTVVVAARYWSAC